MLRNLEICLARVDQRIAAEEALEALRTFAQTTRLEHAYQMLLLLVMISRTDRHGVFSTGRPASLAFIRRASKPVGQ
jgi:hypothetical protein